MKDGSLINLRASWALNYMDAREASTTLCGTLEGAEIKHGGSYAQSELYFNQIRHGKMMSHECDRGRQCEYLRIIHPEFLIYFYDRSDYPGSMAFKICRKTGEKDMTEYRCHFRDYPDRTADHSSTRISHRRTGRCDHYECNLEFRTLYLCACRYFRSCDCRCDHADGGYCRCTSEIISDRYINDHGCRI